MSPVDTEISARAKAQWNHTPIEGVKRLIAVASGKGGVGKSTLAVNLALAAKRAGKKVGLLDADIYGPSLPRMMGLSGKPEVVNNKMVPLLSQQIPCMSMGLLVDEAQALAWRGPMITKALHQMLRLVDWKAFGELDVLFIDLPPGTGDAHISMVQQAPLNGVVLVTTPQEVAVADARKCLLMFSLPQVKVPILGVVENMSYFTDANGQKQYLFGQGGGKRLAEEYGVPFLGEVPLLPEIGKAMDHGKALDISEESSRYYSAIAQALS